MFLTPNILKRSAPMGLAKYCVPNRTVRLSEPKLGPMSKRTTSYLSSSVEHNAAHQLLFLRPPMLPPAASVQAWLSVSSTIESRGCPGRMSTENRFADDKIG